MKLAFLYGLEYWNLSWHWNGSLISAGGSMLTEAMHSLDDIFGTEWDLYMMGLLLALIAATAYLRRVLA